MKAVAARAAGLAARRSNKDPALGGRGASLSSWAKAGERMPILEKWAGELFGRLQSSLSP